jgi:FAD/FMN-containing dehydrogenase
MSEALRHLLALPPRADGTPRQRACLQTEGWGMAVGATARVWRPETPEELRATLADARARFVALTQRGGGNSYGDAAVPAGSEVLDLSRLSRIVAFDGASGLADCESGVTMEQLWRHALPLGYWPKVVSGTMFPTLGGAAAMNIHGKNNFAAGTIGDAIKSFELMLADGRVLEASREQNAELFHAAIGGFGMLGVFTRIRIATQRVYSGDLWVRGVRHERIEEALDFLEREQVNSDYLVAWIDGFATGSALGRGLIHQARYLEPGEDEHPQATLTLAHQDLPRSILGVPKSEVWRALRLFNHPQGMRLINAVKFHASALEVWQGPRRQAHAAFAFLLDYVPNWKWAYGRHEQRGLIQLQAFVPRAQAAECFRALLERSQAASLVPFLGVLKRHRTDPFLLTHAVDGYSLAMDFKVEPRTRSALWEHCGRLADCVLDAGGRFYFAKDATLRPDQVQRMFPPENLKRFQALKRQLDPQQRFVSALSRRVWPDLA